MCHILRGTHNPTTRQVRVLLVAMLVTVGPLSAHAAQESRAVDRPLCERSVNTIRQVLDREQRWAKVQAAEYLLSLDYPDGVEDVFTKEFKSHGSEPQYRIGIWGVFAAGCRQRTRASIMGRQNTRGVLDPAGPDRLAATETLAKIRYRIGDDEIAAMEDAAQREDVERSPYAAWVLMNSDRPAEVRLAALLGSPNMESGPCGACAASPSFDFGGDAGEVAGGRSEGAGGNEARVFLVAAAAVHARPADRSVDQGRELISFAASGDERKTSRGRPNVGTNRRQRRSAVVNAIPRQIDLDFRATAADAILRISRRVPHHLVSGTGP